MIVRKGCFETNSSSTHALCIGKGKLENIHILKSNFLNESDYSDNCMGSDEYLERPSFIKFKSKDDEYFWDYNCNEHKKEIILKRFDCLGRCFKIYGRIQDKLNFVWSCVVNYAYYTDNKYSDLVYKFLEYLYSLPSDKISIKFNDVAFKSENQINKLSKNGKYKILGKLDDAHNIPSNLKNKYMYGEYNLGYFPIKEIYKILQDENLFWNLILGNSKIYTGSDETDLFEDLSFESYSYKLVGGSDTGDCATTNIFAFNGYSKIGSYINGNYETTIYDNGTRIRKLIPYKTFYEQGRYKQENFTKKEIDMMEPEFPESIDLKITNYCENNCTYCYANSNKEGKHADIHTLKNIISQMHPYTEVALGGGNTISYPYLKELLECAKEHNVICNITVKDTDIINNIDVIIPYYENKLIRSIGISPTTSKSLIQCVNLLRSKYIHNFIIHLILGVHGEQLIEELYKQCYIEKVLFLGFKNKGMGESYINKHKEEIDKNTQFVKDIITNYNEKYMNMENISFDNLAIQQLAIDTDNVEYKDYYQGEDGKFSFYIDAVEEEYAKNSITDRKNMFINIQRCMEVLREEY